MEIDFVKCESELQRSETCGVKSKTYRAASFPSNHRRGMSQPKRQITAKRAANNVLLTERSKQDGHTEHVFTLEWKSCTFLPLRYVVRQGFAQPFASASRELVRRPTGHFFSFSLVSGMRLAPWL